MITCDPERISALQALLDRYGLCVVPLASEAVIPGSYWGAPEAGLIGSTVYVRSDTPLHSALHEAAHVVCMDETRRATLNTDAGGEYCEEDAVCYLQIILAVQLGVPSERICADMDEWGYTFRLGSAHGWFTQDAEDARSWLIEQNLITSAGTPTWHCRGRSSTAVVDAG